MTTRQPKFTGSLSQRTHRLCPCCQHTKPLAQYYGARGYCKKCIRMKREARKERSVKHDVKDKVLELRS